MTAFRSNLLEYGSLVLVALCFAVATAVLSSRLTNVPPVWYDEGLYAQVAHNITETGHQFVQTMPGTEISTRFVTGGYTFLLPTAMSFGILGTNVFAARIPIVLFTLLFLLMSFLLLERMYGRRIALLALLLLIVFPNLYAYGKSLLGELPGLLFCILTLVAAYRWNTPSRTRTDTLAVGLFAGLAMVTKPIFILFPIALFMSALLLRLFRRRDFIPAAIGFCLPLVAWVLWQSSVGVFALSTLAYYANPYSVTDVWATIVANLARFGGEATPIFFLVTLIVWLIGMWCRLRTMPPARTLFLELCGLIFTLLVFLAYLRTAGWYRYFFIGQTMALIFLPANLYSILQFYARKREKLRAHFLLRTLPVTMSVLVAIVLAFSLVRSSWIASSWNNDATQVAEPYFRAHTVSGCTYLFNVPEVFLYVAGEKYCQFIAPTNVLVFGGDVLVHAKDASVGDRIVVRASDALLYLEFLPAHAEVATVASYLVYTVKP